MTNQKISTFMYDAYGTLFDVHSVIDKCNEFFPEKGPKISQTWRDKQLQYSYLRQIMGTYETFYSITRDALHYAVKTHGEELDQTSEKELLEAYLQLTAYPEIKGVLDQLPNKKHAIFSNGSHDMLDPLVQQSELVDSFDKLISCDEVKQFKPAIASYGHAAKVMGAKPEEVLFMSSNGWDIAGAKNYGFHTAWINRQNNPIEVLGLEPDVIYQDLTGILEWK